MTTQLSAQPSFERAFFDALETETVRIKEEAIKKAVVDYEREIRKCVGSVAISLIDYYSIERMGGELLIHVKLEKEKQ